SRLEFFLGDVRDRARVQRAFEVEPDLVIHAAALKQVPACEHDPLEAMKTNVLGAANIVDAAIDTRVRRIVPLSTDAAASPLDASVDLVLEAAATMHGGEIFVPEIASATVVDGAGRIAPGCPWFETGLRPGEKLHETLVSDDEAPQTVWRARTDGTRLFIIQP